MITGNGPGHTTVLVDVGTIPAGPGSITISFRAVITNPLPAGVTQVESQGEVNGNQLVAPLPTDDPTTPPVGDSTVTTVTAIPVLVARKTGERIFDSDGSGDTSPEDWLEYTVSITNTGNVGITGVTFSDTVDANVELRGLTLTPAGATVISGSGLGDTTVIVDIVGIPGGGGSVSLKYIAVITDSLPADVTQVGGVPVVINQGVVTSSLPYSLAVRTDDPTIPGSSDPTVITVTAAPVISATKG